jgi:hypothetical protein
MVPKHHGRARWLSPTCSQEQKEFPVRNFFNQLFASSRPTVSRRRSSLQVESLERREVPTTLAGLGHLGSCAHHHAATHCVVHASPHCHHNGHAVVQHRHAACSTAPAHTCSTPQSSCSTPPSCTPNSTDCSNTPPTSCTGPTSSTTPAQQNSDGTQPPQSSTDNPNGPSTSSSQSEPDGSKSTNPDSGRTPDPGSGDPAVMRTMPAIWQPLS